MQSYVLLFLIVVGLVLSVAGICAFFFWQKKLKATNKTNPNSYSNINSTETQERLQKLLLKSKRIRSQKPSKKKH